jgi:hypothetical protein
MLVKRKAPRVVECLCERVSSDVDYSSCGWNHPRKGSANFDAAIGAHGDAGSTRHFDGAAFLSFDGDAINLLGNVLDQFGHVFVVAFGGDDVGVRHSGEGDLDRWLS